MEILTNISSDQGTKDKVRPADCFFLFAIRPPRSLGRANSRIFVPWLALDRLLVRPGRSLCQKTVQGEPPFCVQSSPWTVFVPKDSPGRTTLLCAKFALDCLCWNKSYICGHVLLFPCNSKIFLYRHAVYMVWYNMGKLRFFQFIASTFRY